MSFFLLQEFFVIYPMSNKNPFQKHLTSKRSIHHQRSREHVIFSANYLDRAVLSDLSHTAVCTLSESFSLNVKCFRL